AKILQTLSRTAKQFTRNLLSAKNICPIFLRIYTVQASVRIRVAPQLEARVEPHLKQRDLRSISFFTGVKLVLVNEPDRRHLVSPQAPQQLLCDRQPRRRVILGGNGRKIVDSNCDRASVLLPNADRCRK